MSEEFIPFNKIARLSRECTITEKIDGTNASIHIGKDGSFKVASRTRFITPENDNYGFARWSHEHKDELMLLGAGSHFGEWWGQGIQRNYGMQEKVFSLFNVGKWNKENVPSCCRVVPVISTGIFSSELIDNSLNLLKQEGSFASPNFMKPEGIIIWHDAARLYFKKTIERDEEHKGQYK